MASFKYIGLQTKEDGKIDVRVPSADGSWQTFTDVVPNVTVIDVTDPYAIQALDYSVDPTGLFTYERVA
jgi:hypothetical protein